jgi:serine/threonine protein kinase
MLTVLNDLLERPLKKEITVHDRYKITAFIGKGSYGMVYRAFDQKTSQTVVVKQFYEREKVRILEKIIDVKNALTNM